MSLSLWTSMLIIPCPGSISSCTIFAWPLRAATSKGVLYSWLMAFAPTSSFKSTLDVSYSQDYEPHKAEPLFLDYSQDLW